MGKGSRQPSEMLKSIKRWLTAVGLSAALLLSSPTGFANKAYAARQQQTQQQEAQQVNRDDGEVRILYKYLDLNKKIQKYGDKEIYAIAISHKRNSLEEKVEKILEKHAASIFSEMYSTEGRRDIIIDLTNTPTLLLVVKRSGEEVYKKIYDKSFSENALEKLEDLAEFLGPDAVEKLEEEFKEMSEGSVVKRIGKMIKQAKKGNNKLERKYRAFAKSLEGSIHKGSNKACVNRHVDLNRIMRTVGHEYGHFLYTGSPLQSRDQGEQFVLIETACDLLGDEFSLRYAEKYLKGHPEIYKEYMDSISKMERQSSMGRDLILEVSKLLMAGKIDLAENLMDETAKKMGINEINQANIAVVKNYSGINYVYDELSSMLKELSPDYFVKVIKYTTNFSESSCAYRLMEKINEMGINELKQNYIENQEAIIGLTRNSFPRYIPMDKWEMRKELIKESILLHELHERLPEKEAAEIIKGK